MPTMNWSQLAAECGRLQARVKELEAEKAQKQVDEIQFTQVCIDHVPMGANRDTHPNLENLDYCKKCGSLFKLDVSKPCSGYISRTPAERLAILQELLHPSIYDEDDNFIGYGEPLISEAEAKKLLEIE